MKSILIKAAIVAFAVSPLIAAADDDEHGVRTFQSQNMANIANGMPFTPAKGAAFLTRSKNELQGRVMLADLMPGHAYTIWWFIFNHPKNCSTHPCTPGADFVPGDAAGYHATGVIAASDGGDGGVVNVSFETGDSGPPKGAFVVPGTPAAGLNHDNGLKAEVHFLMIDHGVPTAGFPNVPGSWAFELSHPLPPGTHDVRAAAFMATAP
jgi:hypothetical protein